MSTYLNHRGEAILDKLRLQKERSQLEADERAVQATESERALERHREQTVRRAQVDSEKQAERARIEAPWLRENQRLAQLLGRATAQYEQAAREADDDILDVPKRVNYIGAFAVRGRVQDLITAHEAAKPV